MGPFAGMDPELEKRITSYGTEPVRGSITVNVCDVDGSYGFEKLPDTPDGMIAWIKSTCAGVPEEYRAQLQFALEYERDYYDSGDSASLKIWYERPETDDEMKTRVNSGIAYIRDSDANKRATYEKLKAEFEPVGRPD